MSLKNKLIEKLSLGTATEAELLLLFDLLQDGELEGDTSLEIDLDPKVAEDIQLSKEVSQGILDDISSRINVTGSEHNEANTSSSKMPDLKEKSNVFSLKNWLSRAAVLLILIGAGLSIYLSYSSRTLEHSTLLGEVKTIELPDGSMVVLNESSTISYPRKWQEDQDRIVALNGQAYFKVEKKPSTNVKFKVKTNDLSIEVLGTIFNVNSIDEKTIVFLEEGKVVVKLEDEKDIAVELESGEIVEYSSKVKALGKPKTMDEAIHNSWKENMLKFKNIPLFEITERVYALSGIKINMQNGVDVNPKYSIAIPLDDIEAAMEIISKTTGYKVVKKNPQTLILSNQ